MRIKPGRAGGHTTQLFLEILASDQDIVVLCRNKFATTRLFIDRFPEFILQTYSDKVILIDNRTIKFVNATSEYNKLVGLQGKIMSDIGDD